MVPYIEKRSNIVYTTHKKKIFQVPKADLDITISEG